MKKQLCILGVLFSLGVQAQGKVGINTETPTEALDVKGTMRIRTLPVEGNNKIYTTGEDTSAQSTNQAFTPKGIVVADERGVLGLAPGGLKTNAGATADNNSTAMFVKKRYTAKDWPSGKDTNTGFSTDKWDAILTINKFGRSGTMNGAFLEKSNASVQLDVQEKDGFWRVVGDVSDMSESWEFTILYINKNYIVSDDIRVNY